jgi:hypothetical protein
MDDHRFDRLTQALAARAPRRVVIGVVIGTALSRLCGVDGGVGIAKKKRKKKKKPPASPCQPKCGGKVCGDPDACGGFCTACPSGQVCQSNQCVTDSCGRSCRGNHVCENGNCVCEAALKACDAYHCGECCPDPFFGNGDSDCNNHPNGPYCTTEANDPVLQCTCGSLQKRCGDGRCVNQCCGLAECLVDYGPGSFCNVHTYCQCPDGLDYCGPDLGCVDSLTNRFACGAACIDCGAGRLCENGNCCVGLANPCGFGINCCAGLACVNTGTVYEPEFVCG